MDDRQHARISKFLSYVLRHRPQAIGIELDPAGWVSIDSLLERCARRGRAITRDELDEVVRTSPKRRFAVSEDGRRIRASQGHTVAVDLGYVPACPPEILYHGTVASAVRAIRRDGLRRMRRHHVHLSPDEATAAVVGGRRGTAVILHIAAGEMHRRGFLFFRTTNDVWLTDHVPPELILETAGQTPDGEA